MIRASSAGDRAKQESSHPGTVAFVMRYAASLGAVLAFVAVALGALGAHSLKAVLAPPELEWIKTGTHYQLAHAIALLMAGTGSFVRPRWAALSAGFFVAGIVLFCGSLYGLAFGAPRWFGAIAPLGGGALLIGWLCLAAAAWPAPDRVRTSE